MAKVQVANGVFHGWCRGGIWIQFDGRNKIVSSAVSSIQLPLFQITTDASLCIVPLPLFNYYDIRSCYNFTCSFQGTLSSNRTLVRKRTEQISIMAYTIGRQLLNHIIVMN